MDGQDLFHKTLDQLLEANKHHRDDLIETRYEFSAEQYAEFFGTICCDVGRMVGKTEYILRNASADDAIVVSSRKFRSLLKQRFVSNAKLLIPEDFIKRRNWNRFSRIFVDEPAEVFKKIGKKKLYKTLAKDYEQTFIFLGNPWFLLGTAFENGAKQEREACAALCEKIANQYIGDEGLIAGKDCAKQIRNRARQ